MGFQKITNDFQRFQVILWDFKRTTDFRGFQEISENFKKFKRFQTVSRYLKRTIDF